MPRSKESTALTLLFLGDLPIKESSKRGCFYAGLSLGFAKTSLAQKKPEQWVTWTPMGENEAWCSMQLFPLRQGWESLSDPRCVCHGDLEASVPDCDFHHLVGPLGQIQVGRKP